MRAAFANAGLALALVTLGCDARLYPIRDTTTPLHCPTEMLGFATLGDGTVGGGTATPVTVTSADAFRAAAEAEAPAVILVDGNFALDDQVHVASNKTIKGVDHAGFTGAGLDLTGSENIIIQNLSIARAVGEDAITVQRSRNVWIDHCDLGSDRDHPQGYYDGLVDITHASDYVTVSWTVMHDHFDSGLVGHSDDNGAEDTGHLTVTLHHNDYTRIESGPRVRFGRVHVYDNLFEDVTLYAVVSQLGAQALIEQNWFARVTTPIITSYKGTTEGAAHEVGNVYRDSGPSEITMDAAWRPPYPYNADSAENAQALVSVCAGADKL
jgi:pectate lyase